MTNDQIFSRIGLTAEQIRALALALTVPRARVIVPPDVNRVICKVCGRPVGLYTCKPVRQSDA